ncbi:hypothetical protein BX666DRAFT_2110489 [Dichotomocladium elegans]|nr:hypothetical protein BX666DRAFT_2110489 [Dichotomocladium elegans]
MTTTTPPKESVCQSHAGICALHIPGYHFDSHISSKLTHGGAVDYLYGSSVSTQTPIVAKVSAQSFQLEQEFYLMKKLYQVEEGPRYLVLPLDLIYLPSGLRVSIFANELNAVPFQLPLINACVENDNTSAKDDDNDLQKKQQQRQSINIDTFLKLAIQCVDCLEFIHRHGFVHGEIQPSAFHYEWPQSSGDDNHTLKLWNIGSGAKALDVYLHPEWWRKFTNSEKSIKDLQTMLVYISPEQTGRSTYTVSHRSDIYSLGMMFYVMLTDQYPFDGGPIEIINSIISRKIPMVHQIRPEIPAMISKIVEKMTNKSPDERYASAHGIKADLGECLKRLQAPCRTTGGDVRNPSSLQITSFPLARHDVASVFTLPQAVYGRQRLTHKIVHLVQSYMSQCKSAAQSRLGTAKADIPTYMQHIGGIEHNDNSCGVHPSAAAATAQSCFSKRTNDPNIPDTAAVGTLRPDNLLLSTNSLFPAPALTAGRQRTRIIGINGPGGTGKSTIFRVILITARKFGYVAATKFDASKKSPYGGFIAALSQILEQILSEPQYKVEAFRKHLKDSLNDQLYNVHLLLDVIPKLAPLLACNHNTCTIPSPQVGNQSNNIGTQIRFQNIFVELLRYISAWCPVAIFLDDIHLSDGPSLELVQALVASRVKVLLCIAYRETEVPEKLQEVLTNDDSDNHILRVGGLDMKAIIDLVCDTLHRSRATDRYSVRPFAEVIHKRTCGNAFYVVQLLRAFERKKYIYFDWERNIWDFSLDAIEDSIKREEGPASQKDGSVDAVVSFLVSRFKELPQDEQNILQWAAFVGDTFSLSDVSNLTLTASSSSRAGGDNGDTIGVSGPHHDDDDDEESLPSPSSSPLLSPSCEDRRILGQHPATGSRYTGLEDDPAKAIKVLRSSRRPLQSTTAESSSDESQRSDDSHRVIETSVTQQADAHLPSKARNIMGALYSIIQEGYIVQVQGDVFRWSHDCLSQAAMNLADPEETGQIHFRIAKQLMKGPDVDVFHISNNLLKCERMVAVASATTAESWNPFRDILITAGNRSRALGAHKMAFAYYKSAIRLGEPAVDWNDANYDKSLSLYTNAAALSWIVGEYCHTENILTTLFRYSRNAIDRFPAYQIRSNYYSSRQMHEQGNETLLECLDDLGYGKFTIDITDAELATVYEEVDTLIKTIGMDAIVFLGVCDDPLLQATMSILEEMCTVAYWLGKKKEMYALACRILKLSMTKGMTNVSGIAFIFAGLGYVELYKQFNYGEMVGSIGVKLSEKYSSNYEIGRTYFLYGLFLLPWKRAHQRESMRWFQTAMPISTAAGDRIFGSFSQLHIAASMLTLGHNLNDVARQAESVFQDTKTWTLSSNAASLSQCLIRTVKSLQGLTYTDTPEVFDGDDGFCDQTFVSQHCHLGTSNPEVPLSWYESYKIMPLVLYGHWDEAIRVGYRCLASLGSHPCHKHVAMMLFYFSLALVEKLRSAAGIRGEEQTAYLDQLEANQEFLHEWAIHSPINYLMYWTMVEAERATLETPLDIGKVGHLYEKSIDQAREGAWVIEMCVMHEFTGAFYDRCGMHNVAHGFIKKAIRLYKGHGSFGKAQHLNKKYRKLLERCGDRRERVPAEAGVQTDGLLYAGEGSTLPGSWNPLLSKEGTTQAPTTSANEPFIGTSIPPVTLEQTLMTLDIIDMASVLKSSQAMSSEVKFDDLLKGMMSIILENTGAGSGAIIVKENGYGICAYGSQEAGVRTYDPPRMLSEDNDQVSTLVIQHTLRSKESIFMYNVAEDQQFAIGPWFERVGAESVICIPIIHKSDVMGCIFVEGPMGIFTHRHITVLGLLCQQIAISIANASLFKSVQHATLANMKMIEMQKQALVDATRSKEEADRAMRLREMFLANMSHEIRTPFSGFYGMISLLAETDLDPEQRDLIKIAKQSCEILLRLIDDLLDFSKLQAGKMELDLSSVVVEDIIVDVIEMLTAMSIQRKINMSHIIAADVPAVIIADPNRLRQIIINLVGNAIKFTHEGEVVVRCSVDKGNTVDSRDRKDGKISLLFEVIDSGIGISEEQQRNLFIPFSQVDGSTTRKYGGTGLGLSICLQLVKLMEGNIGVASVPNHGSNFHFTIVTEQALQPSKQREDIITRLVSQMKGARILVTGKHEATIAMIRSLLDGVTVDGANTVDELRSYNPCDYHVLIVGIFLAHDPEFEAWAATLTRFMDQISCIVILHYPSGIVAEGLGKSYLPMIDHLEDHNAGKGSNNNSGSSSSSSSSSSSEFENIGIHDNKQSREKKSEVIRMSLPLRRQKMLRGLTGIIGRAAGLGPKRRAQAKEEAKPEREKITPKKDQTLTKLRQQVSTQFKGMNILIAEDNAVAQKLLFMQLTKLSFHVVCANNGSEAVEAWEKYPDNYFKMAFFDHHMPKCDGIQATRIIRELEAERSSQGVHRLSIVALTADIQTSAREACMKAGMDGYLTKPMNQKVLLDTLLRYCKDS